MSSHSLALCLVFVSVITAMILVVIVKSVRALLDHCLSDQQTPVMIIGTHELRGKVEDLAQPFCVLQKASSNNADDDDDSKEYRITGLVNRKIVFNRYPKTIMR